MDFPPECGGFVKEPQHTRRARWQRGVGPSLRAATFALPDMSRIACADTVCSQCGPPPRRRPRCEGRLGTGPVPAWADGDRPVDWTPWVPASVGPLAPRATGAVSDPCPLGRGHANIRQRHRDRAVPLSSPARRHRMRPPHRRTGPLGITLDRIDHVVLNCRDVQATVSWYQHVLGMTKEEFGPDRRIALTFGNQKLNVRPTGAPGWETGAVDAPGSLDLCFVASTPLGKAAEHLHACGVAITAGPVSRTGALGPMTSIYCRDPDGNLVEIACYPPAR
jgi:catechol 2,3-dioxygenase-like lactoylglutathione lyase family enzyme